MKRLLSLVLTLVMLLGIICVAPISVGAAEAELIEVYFENNWLWSDVFYHAWGSTLDTNTEWGKGKVELVGTSADGYDIYKAVIGSDSTGLIFAGTKNDNSGKTDQTPDIESGIVDGICYKMAWKDESNQVETYMYKVPVETEPATEAATTEAATTEAAETTAAAETTDVAETTAAAAETYTVYYVDSAYFDTVYAYAWSGVEKNAEWPGVEMTPTDLVSPDGSPVYSYTTDALYENIIFSDGAGSQTGDLTFTPDQYLYWSDEIWYENLEDIENASPPYIAPGYYIVGTFNNENMWYVDEYSEDRLLVENEAAEGEYMLDYTFTEGDEIKVVYFNGETIETWYNDGGDNYGIGADKAGNCTIYFRPDGNADWSYYYFTVVKKVCEHVFNSNNVCVKCAELKEGVLAGVAGYRLSLGGNIAVMQYVAIADEVLNDAQAKMIITVPDTGSSYEIVIPVADFVESGGFYEFTYEVAAKEIASKNNLKLVTSTTEVDLGEFSVKQYCEYTLGGSVASDQLKEVARTMLNYGAAAQTYFNYNTDNLANASDYMTEEDKISADADCSQYAYTLTGEAEGVTYYGSSLSLKSETTINHYFAVEEGVEPVFTVNGNEVTATKKGDLYVVKVENISAHMLGNSFQVKIGDLTLDYSALSYIYDAINAGKANLKNLANAMVAYYEAVRIFGGQ